MTATDRTARQAERLWLGPPTPRFCFRSRSNTSVAELLPVRCRHAQRKNSQSFQSTEGTILNYPAEIHITITALQEISLKILILLPLSPRGLHGRGPAAPETQLFDS